jgi:predicted ABC-type ATPase
MYYFRLGSADLAVQRVRERVRSGGHDVPEDTIRLRYTRSLRNFWAAYRYEADSWFVYDNSASVPVLLGAGRNGDEPLVAEPEAWREFREEVGYA